MADVDEALAAKTQIGPVLLGRPGVHSVGIGTKTVGGQPTNEIAIVVLVVKKKSPAELAPGEMIPAEVNGVKTDVVEVPIPSAHQTTPNPDTDKIRPLVGGIQISGPSR